MKKICPLCETENDEDARFCKECNEPLYNIKAEEKEFIEKERLNEEREDEWIPDNTRKVNSKNESSELSKAEEEILATEIMKEGKLPIIDLQSEGLGQVILKKGEVVHCGDGAILKEVKTVNLGYKGGSQGISIPIFKGIRYRVGSSRGHVVKEDKLVESSRGVLLVTSLRLFLFPIQGCKPISIPLNKIISYHCSNNEIEAYKEGREKGYFFSLLNSSSMENFKYCLAHLLSR